MKVRINELEKMVRRGITKLGYEGKNAGAIFDALMYAELRGNNQGIVKIATDGIPKATDVKPFEVVKQSKCSALLSGGHIMATTAHAADLAVDLAEKHGVGLVCSNHTYSSSGAIGFYARKIAKKGYIGLVCVGNGGFCFVAPTGSHEARFGTNPIAYSFPHQDGEVVFDNATSAMAFFGLVEAKLKGESIPPGIGYNSAGQPSCDPAEILDGSVATFAGHKGYGLSLLVQVLGGPFSLAGTPGVNEDDGTGTFVMALSPELFAGQDEFIKRTTQLVKEIKSAKPLAGEKVYLPGEQGDIKAMQAINSGEIEIDAKIWDKLCQFSS